MDCTNKRNSTKTIMWNLYPMDSLFLNSYIKNIFKRNFRNWRKSTPGHKIIPTLQTYKLYKSFCIIVYCNKEHKILSQFIQPNYWEKEFPIARVKIVGKFQNHFLKQCINKRKKDHFLWYLPRTEKARFIPCSAIKV